MLQFLHFFKTGFLLVIFKWGECFLQSGCSQGGASCHLGHLGEIVHEAPVGNSRHKQAFHQSIICVVVFYCFCLCLVVVFLCLYSAQDLGRGFAICPCNAEADIENVSDIAYIIRFFFVLHKICHNLRSFFPQNLSQFKELFSAKFVTIYSLFSAKF